MRGGEPPAVDRDRITWHSPRLGIDAELVRRAPAYEETLIDGVRWRCEQPAADARIGAMRGDGYAEVLELEIAPWEVPIDELRWGRVVDASQSMTWIEWRGPHPFKRLLIDGIRSEAALPEPAENRTIRDQRLGDTIPIPGLPKRIADAHEQKWCGRVGSAWAVHEVVRFG